jgi:serine O-acetyltransferase
MKELTLITKILEFQQTQNRKPKSAEVINWVKSLREFLFPSTRIDCGDNNYSCVNQFLIKHNQSKLTLQKIILDTNDNNLTNAIDQSEVIFTQWENVYDLLKSDLKAIFEADPAALTETEVLICYPGFLAILYHRIANVFFVHNQKLIARIISEYAHSKTGIDIHPGATIGKSFCIDHGTGIVIGETCVIGNNVKIFQGVTLGALSVTKDQAQHQRHPIIGNNVTIYAGVTILGGKTVIGDNSIIGGNTWITKSVENGDKVYFKQT